MNKGLKLASIALLCIFGTQSVFAGPFRPYGGREGFRAARQQRNFQQEARPQALPEGRRGEPQSVGNASAPPSRRFEQEPAGNFVNRSPGQGRQPGPMSREDRIKLRRDINDAAHELYEPHK